MPNLSLWQCAICVWGEFTATSYSGVTDGGTVKLNADGSTFDICGGCVATLKAREGMFELTGDVAKPVRMRAEWPPKREQTGNL